MDISGDSSLLRTYSELFVEMMNKKAKELKMEATTYSNPHGLDRPEASSTVKDVAILARTLLDNKTAMQVMGQRNYTGRIYGVMYPKKGENKSYRQVDWENTNRLLMRKGYIGGKTGMTNRAGNCLQTIFQEKGRNYIIVVLGCKGREDRFDDTDKLVKHYIAK